MSGHPDDEFHVPKDDDPFWTETCWWTFDVPERKLTGQLYPFFRPNQDVAACAVYLWDDRGDDWATCLYARQTWHLPLNGQPLSDIALANGLRYKVLEPATRYQLEYRDPDGDDVGVELEFTAVHEANHDGHGHMDQAGHMKGVVTIDGDRIEVDSYGFHDRSWGRRGGFGRRIIRRGGEYGGYSFATESPAHGFHALTFDMGNDDVELVHGYLVEGGELAKLASGRRRVVERDPATGYQRRIELECVDERGRTLEAEGVCHNAFGFLLNPNIWSVNNLTDWTFNGHRAWGEDHDNWAPTGYRRFYRRFLGYEPALTGGNW
jgi:hypothetical protein